MALPSNFTDIRIFLHIRDIDHAWLRTVLLQYLGENGQTGSDRLTDHQVWTVRNTISEFTQLLNEDVDLDDDE
jgi:hypothetical protein